MASVWTQSAIAPAGLIQPVRFVVGPEGRHSGADSDVAVPLGNVRVGFVGDAQPPERFTALVRPASGAIAVPVDLPFELSLDLPAELLITPAAAPAAPRGIVVSASLGLTAALRYAANWFRIVQPAEILPIPPWTRSVSIFDVDIPLTFWDSAGNTLAAFTGPLWDIPRPRHAVTCGIAGRVAASLLFHYTS